MSQNIGVLKGTREKDKPQAWLMVAIKERGLDTAKFKQKEQREKAHQEEQKSYQLRNEAERLKQSISKLKSSFNQSHLNSLSFDEKKAFYDSKKNSKQSGISFAVNRLKTKYKDEQELIENISYQDCIILGFEFPKLPTDINKQVKELEQELRGIEISNFMA